MVQLNERLAAAVRQRRTELGYTQMEVSEAGGPSDVTIGKIETGEGSVAQSTLYRLDHSLQWPRGAAQMILQGRAVDLPERAAPDSPHETSSSSRGERSLSAQHTVSHPIGEVRLQLDLTADREEQLEGISALDWSEATGDAMRAAWRWLERFRKEGGSDAGQAEAEKSSGDDGGAGGVTPIRSGSPDPAPDDWRQYAAADEGEQVKELDPGLQAQAQAGEENQDPDS